MLSGGEKGRNWDPWRRRGFLCSELSRGSLGRLGVKWVSLGLEVCQEGWRGHSAEVP